MVEGARTRRGRVGGPLAWIPFLLACCAVALAVVLAATLDLPAAGGSTSRSDAAVTIDGPARPVSNDCSGGVVHLTFDDGPGVNTPLLLDRLDALNLKAVFFVIGHKVRGHEAMIARMVAAGHGVQNHSLRHFNLVTGVDTAGVARTGWDERQIAFELARAGELIHAAGAPVPTQYRPPYGAVDGRVDRVAKQLGLQLIMPWDQSGAGTIVDTKDTVAGVTTADIQRSAIDALAPGNIITMHDGIDHSALSAVAAMQAIADAMNARKLCSSADIQREATGTVFGDPAADGSAGREE